MIENPLSWVYFPTAVALGALHALEPGHAKTLTAAYLIGIKGTRRDAFLLGLSVAFTHSLVVIAIAAGALWVGQEAFTKDVTHYLQLGSGVLVVALGSWMLFKRLRQMRRAQMRARSRVPGREGEVHAAYQIAFVPASPHVSRPVSQSVAMTFKPLSSGAHSHHHHGHDHGHDHHHGYDHGHAHDHHDHDHDHDLMTDDEHARAHAATIPDYAKRGERPSWQQILAFGAAGGMIPCPASITVMLLALSIGKVASGLLAVAGFSLGLALALVGIGLMVVAGLNRLSHTGKFDWLSAQAPVLSAGVVILSGVAALVFAH
ncbi:MAG: sulfite exporter TauE/SafE family protein [Oligoflexia bacterium]|nr:sulfite exporter TauE/SafE family protein [Oligoflexia bacterium]